MHFIALIQSSNIHFHRSVDNDFEIHEDFIGLHECEKTTGNYLVAVIKNILTSCNFDFSKIRGQCYDKGSAMSGKKVGVKTQILSEEPRALYIHCFNHALNLAVCDTLKKIPILKDGLSFSNELLILIKKSPKRETKLKNIKQSAFDNSPGIRNFSYTRWTVKGDSLDSIISNYLPLLEVLEESYYEESQTDMKSRINGVRFQMKSFDYFYGISLAKKILILTDNLAKKLQKKDISASEGKQLYKNTVLTLEAIKSDDFEQFWNDTLKKSQNFDIKQPELKRIKKKPAKFIDSDEEDDTQGQRKYNLSRSTYRFTL